MRKLVYAICEQQRRRSAQSDQRLSCSLPGSYNTPSFYIRNFKTLSSFCGWADRFVSYLVATPKTGLLVTRLKWEFGRSLPCCNEKRSKTNVAFDKTYTGQIIWNNYWGIAMREIKMIALVRL